MLVERSTNISSSFWGKNFNAAAELQTKFKPKKEKEKETFEPLKKKNNASAVKAREYNFLSFAKIFF